MERKGIKVNRIKDHTVLFGKDKEDTNFIFKENEDGNLEFSHFSDDRIAIFFSYVDTSFATIIEDSILWIFKKGEVPMEKLFAHIAKQNLLNMKSSSTKQFYKHLLCKFISLAATSSLQNFHNGSDYYDLVEIQHGKNFVKHYPVQLNQPYILFQYCTISAIKKEETIETEGKKCKKIKLIVRYHDKTAPTHLGDELSEALALLSTTTNSAKLYEKISQMSIRLHNKYTEQTRYFGNEMMEMLNRQVY